MGTYIPFTEEEKRRAIEVDLETFLERQGERLLPAGREKRMSSDHSVTIRGNLWFDHSIQEGGGPVSFVQHFYQLGYADAITLLLSGDGGRSFPFVHEQTADQPKPFLLPEKNGALRRLYAYLVKEREIRREVVDYFVQKGLLYEEAQYHNCVFVGADCDGVPRYAHMRSTNRKGRSYRLNVAGSDQKFSFHHLGSDGSLYVLEAPIDLLSYISLYPEGWQEHSYMACGGLSVRPVIEMLEEMRHLERVFLCLDQDEAGQAASQRMETEIKKRFQVSVERLIPEQKDWNDVLLEKRKEGRRVDDDR